jgi:hypothetical protein
MPSLDDDTDDTATAVSPTLPRIVVVVGKIAILLLLLLLFFLRVQCRSFEGRSESFACLTETPHKASSFNKHTQYECVCKKVDFLHTESKSYFLLFLGSTTYIPT